MNNSVYSQYVYPTSLSGSYKRIVIKMYYYSNFVQGCLFRGGREEARESIVVYQTFTVSKCETSSVTLHSLRKLALQVVTNVVLLLNEGSEE